MYANNPADGLIKEKRCVLLERLPFQAFSSEPPPKQQTIAALVHRKISEEITPGSTRLQIMRNSLKLPEAKMGVNCSKTGCSTFARCSSSSPQQDVHGLNVRLYWISMEIIYFIVKEAPIE